MLKAAIFDIDGTVVDIDSKGIYELYSGISKYFKKNTPRIDSMYKHWYGIDEKQIYEELNVSTDDFWEVFRKNDNEEFRRKYLYAYNDLSVISELENKGCFVGFNTDAPHIHGLIQLNQIGISDPYIVANHNGIPRKPDPSGLLKIMRENNLVAKNTIYIGDSEKDIIAGMLAGVRTALIDRGHINKLRVTPDYILRSLTEIDELPERYYEKLVAAIDTRNIIRSLSEDERFLLDIHFKRVRHHSLVMGALCKSFAEYLGLTREDAIALGIFHDIDYAKSFFDMSQHGPNSKSFIDNLFTENMYLDVSDHMNKNSTSKRSLFLYAIEGWIKRFVHSARMAEKSIKDVTLFEIDHIYSSFDPRRNELLTHYDKVESFDEFSRWQVECSKIITGLPFNVELLFNNTKTAFDKYTSIISDVSVSEEMRCIYGR
jgi:HAD superfamily hydrolase (TIGR01549 family)